MKRTLVCSLVLLSLQILTLAGCRSTVGDDERVLSPIGSWDPDRAEILEWSSVDPAFGQDRAMEASGLAGVGEHLLATSEKYRRLIWIDTKTLRVEVELLDVPGASELEGVTVLRNEALICDEATAGVWSVDVGETAFESPTKVTAVPLVNVDVAAGKIGLEGIAAVGDASERLYVLLERAYEDDGSCASEIFPVLYREGVLVADGETLRIPLEDCNWRLTSLEWWQGRLYALKTRFPGEKYEVVVIDVASGDLTRVLEITDLLIGVRDQGWHNNVEGLAFTSDGAMWLISDNAMTSFVNDLEPPPAERKTLLMRIPTSTGN